MAVSPVKSERSLYMNGVRQQWGARVAAIHSMTECTSLLREFRTNHVGPERMTYRLNNDALWIENAIEQRLAQLKVLELDDVQLATTCTSQELATTVCDLWASRLELVQAARDIEAIGIEFRTRYKPPIMPVNAWMRAERAHVTKLMVAQGNRCAQSLSNQQLRVERGAKLVGTSNMKSHRITARFEDGSTLDFECGEQEDVITAAFREQILLLSQCRQGQCTTCKAVCASGERRFGDGVNVYSLPQEEQDEGLVLLCQTYPKSDLVIDVPYSRDMISFGNRAGHEFLLVRIHAFERCTPTVHRLVVEHLNPKTMRPRELSYTPGQYLNISIPGTDQWRSFSMACPPRDDGQIEFLVKDLPGGMFSEQFWRSARVGLELVVQGPYGMFHINRHSGRPRCFLAGGTGIAPILAMLRQMQRTGDETPSWLSLCVGEGDAQLCVEELAAVQKTMRTLRVERVTSSRSDTRALESFMAAVASFFPRPDVYLCGPDGLVASAELACRASGIDARQIYCERFVQTGILSNVPRDDFTPSAGLRRI